jgi:HAD superfamily hydrolase (TIGR01509 family)
MATTRGDLDASAGLLQPVFPWFVFDMDGTLVDTFQLNLRSFNHAVKRNLTPEEALDIPSGTLEEQLNNYVSSGGVPRAIERFHAHYKRHFESTTRVFPGIRELLFVMRAKGIKLAVCTGASGQIAEYTLARSELSDYFPTVVTGDDVRKPKPDPSGLRLVMEKIGAHSDQTVYVGDHPDDITASRNTGARTAAKWGSQHVSELDDLKPDFLLRHPSEALTLSYLRAQESFFSIHG